MIAHNRPLALALACLIGLGSVVGCSRCGSSAAPSAASAPASSAAPAPADASDAAAVDAVDAGAATPSDAESALPVADVPEVKDPGSGRASAALRAALLAYGIPFDPVAIERECSGDDDGTSLDDLEEAALKHGLEAGAMMAPVEHVLLPEAKLLPAILLVDVGDEEQDFVLAWRTAGDRVQVMTPETGRRWILRAELERSLHVEESSMPVEEVREAMGGKDFADALRARMGRLGVDDAAARGLLARATAAPGWRGLAALDAVLRDAATRQRGDAGAASLDASFACALDPACKTHRIAPSAWSVRATGKPSQGDPQVILRGAVFLAIVGRAPASP